MATQHVASQMELEAMNTLGQVLDFAQVPGGDPNDGSCLRGALLIATGASETSLPRAFGVIPEDQFEGVINSIRISTVAANLFQRGCLLAVGIL